MIYAGIDPSLTGTTICILSRKESLFGAHIHYFHRVTTKETGIQRLIEIEHEVKQTFKLYRPDVVCIEGYSFGSRGKAVFQIGELGGILRRLLHMTNRVWYEIPPTMLKKYATGKGTATKESVVLHVYKKYGIECETNDEADAYILARIAYNLHYTQDETTGYQETILKNLRDTKGIQCISY